MVASGDRRILFKLGLEPDPQAQAILNGFAQQAQQVQSRLTAAMRKAAAPSSSTAPTLPGGLTAKQIAEAEKYEAKLEEQREKMAAKLKAQFAKEDAAAQAAKDKELAQLIEKEKRYHEQLLKQQQKAAEAKAAETDKYWAGEARRIDKAITDSEVAQSKLAAAGGDLKEALGGAAQGTIKLVKGFAEAGLVGEKDSKKILDGLLKIQSAYDKISGAIDIYQSLSKVVASYTNVVKSMAAAETAATAARALGGAVGGGKAAKAAQAVGTAADLAGGVQALGGAGLVAKGAGLAKAGAVAAAPVVGTVAAVGAAIASTVSALAILKEAFDGSANNVNSWSQKIASLEVKFADFFGGDFGGDKRFAKFKESSDAFQKEHKKNARNDRLDAIELGGEFRKRDAEEARRKDAYADRLKYGDLASNFNYHPTETLNRELGRNNPFKSLLPDNLVNPKELKGQRLQEEISDGKELAALDKERVALLELMAQATAKKKAIEAAQINDQKTGAEQLKKLTEDEVNLRGKIKDAVDAEAAAAQKITAHRIEGARQELELTVQRVAKLKEAAGKASDDHDEALRNFGKQDPLKQQQILDIRERLIKGEDISKEEREIVEGNLDAIGKQALDDQNLRRAREFLESRPGNDFGAGEAQEERNLRGRASIVQEEARGQERELRNYGEVNVTGSQKVELKVNFDDQFVETVMRQLNEQGRLQLEATKKQITDEIRGELEAEMKQQADQAGKNQTAQLRASRLMQSRGVA